MITDAIVQWLIGQGAVTAAVGQNVFPALLLRGAALPAIELELVSHETGKTLQGPSGSNVAHYTIHCFAATYGAAEALARTVYGLLNGFSGTFAGGSGGSAATPATAETCWVEDVRDGIYASAPVDALRLFWKQLDVEIRYIGG